MGGDRVLVLVPQWAALSDAERSRYLRRIAKGGSAESAPIEREERVVIGRARVRTRQRFKGGLGQEVEWLEAGSVLEVLRPDRRDQADIDRQVRMDKRQLVALRWQNRVVLLYASDVERI